MKKTVVAAALIISATAAILYGLWASRPVAEVYVAQRGTAISAVYGTVKVLASMSINVKTRSSGTIHFSEFVATNSFVGLDQVNATLPKSLRGRGEVDVILTVDGLASNAVKIRIK